MTLGDNGAGNVDISVIDYVDQSQVLTTIDTQSATIGPFGLDMYVPNGWAIQTVGTAAPSIRVNYSLETPSRGGVRGQG